MLSKAGETWQVLIKRLKENDQPFVRSDEEFCTACGLIIGYIMRHSKKHWQLRNHWRTELLVQKDEHKLKEFVVRKVKSEYFYLKNPPRKADWLIGDIFGWEPDGHAKEYFNHIASGVSEEGNWWK